jgi:hypothetical protein
MSAQSSNAEKPASDDIERKRIEDFAAKYANNVFIESSAWDLRLVFGQLELSPSTAIIEHTAISIPWPQVKVVAYLLGIHLLSHEAQYGRIVLPENAVKTIPAKVPDDIKAIPNSTEVWQKLRKHFEEFIAENPEAFTQPK